MQPSTEYVAVASPKQHVKPIVLILGALMLMALTACQTALADSSTVQPSAAGETTAPINALVSSSIATEASVLNHSEVSLHGDLVWRGGRLWIITPRGPVRLMLPSLDFLPDVGRLQDSNGSETGISLGKYGVIGTWSLVDTGLGVNVREIAQWPFRTFALDHCGDGRHHFEINSEQIGIHGALVRHDGQLFLKTSSGLVFVHLNGHSDLAQDGTFAPDEIVRHDVVLIGPWKTDGSELHMEANQAVRIKTVCEPTSPPRHPILPGEIGALGHLVFENGRPFLETPQGRIVLLTRDDGTPSAPQPLPEDFFDGDILGNLVPDDQAPESLRFPRQIIVVGKWFVYRNQLAIQVRYAVPYPYPQPSPTDVESLAPWDLEAQVVEPAETEVVIAQLAPSFLGEPANQIAVVPVISNAGSTLTNFR